MCVVFIILIEQQFLSQKEIDGLYKYNDKPKSCQSILKTSTIALYAQPIHMQISSGLGLASCTIYYTTTKVS